MGTGQGDDEHTPTVLLGTNPIVVAKVRDLRTAGRMTEPCASAFEGVRDVLEEGKTQHIMAALGRLTPESGSLSLSRPAKTSVRRTPCNLRNGPAGNTRPTRGEIVESSMATVACSWNGRSRPTSTSPSAMTLISGAGPGWRAPGGAASGISWARGRPTVVDPRCRRGATRDRRAVHALGRCQGIARSSGRSWSRSASRRSHRGCMWCAGAPRWRERCRYPARSRSQYLLAVEPLTGRLRNRARG